MKMSVVLPVSASAWMLCVAVTAGGQSARYAGPRFNFGAPVGAVAVADIDADGWPDLLAATGGLRVRRGLGEGAFGPLATYGGVGTTGALEVSDLDADGDLDAVVMQYSAGATTSKVTIYKGSPGGTFGPPVSTTIGGLSDADLGDMDGDGVADLVLLLYGSPSVQVRHGLGNATFGAPTIYPLAQVGYSLCIADVDGDGIPDVAVSIPSTGSVAILASHGDSTLDAPVTFPAGPEPRAITEADFDGDGHVDLAVGSYSTESKISVLRGIGDGGFLAPVAYDTGYVYCSAIEASDVDRDGHVDLMAVVYGRACIFLGHGDGSFDPVVTRAAGPSTQGSLAIADLDRDGAPDLVTGNGEGDDVTVLWSAGADELTSAVLTEEPESLPVGLAVDDLDGDGIPDAFVTYGSAHSARAWLGHADGSFTEAGVMEGLGTPASPLIARLDDDDLPDVLVLDRLAGAVLPFLGIGDGTFAALPAIPVGAAKAYRMVLGDFDLDGHLDLAVVHESPAHISVLKGLGAGLFGSAALLGPIHGSSGRALAVGDVTGDGVLDLIAASAGGTEDLTLLVGQGDGTFPVTKYFEGGKGASDIGLGDLDGSGRLDLVVTHGSAPALTISMNTGNPIFPFQNFGAPIDVFPSDSASANDVEVLDIDGNGTLDVLIDRSGSQRIELFRGNGQGQLVASDAFALPGDNSTIAVADWNADGAPDVLAATGLLSVLLNRTTLAWTSVGAGLAGTDGIPHLHGEGALLGGDPLALELDHARPLAPATLIAGLAKLKAPFKGGVLVPSPDLVLAGFVTDGAGTLDVPATWPVGLPSGLTLWLQFWVADPAAPSGFAASGGVAATSH